MMIKRDWKPVQSKVHAYKIEYKPLFGLFLRYTWVFTISLKDICQNHSAVIANHEVQLRHGTSTAGFKPGSAEFDICCFTICPITTECYENIFDAMGGHIER